jgi:hypothetical protein
LTKETLTRNYTEKGSLQSRKSTRVTEYDPFTGSREGFKESKHVKGASKLQKGAIDALTKEIMLNFSSPETQKALSIAREAGMSEEDIRKSGILKDLLKSGKEKFGEDKYKGLVDEILGAGDLNDPKKLLEMHLKIKDALTETNKQKDITTTIDQISVRTAKAQLESAIELRKMKILDTSELEDQISTAETLGSLSQKDLRALKDRLQLRQLENKLLSSRIDVIAKEVSQMEGVSQELEDINNLTSKINGLTAKQLTEEDKVREVIAESSALRAATPEQLKDIVKLIMDQFAAGKKLNDEEKRKLERTLKIKGANEDIVEEMSATGNACSRE